MYEKVNILLLLIAFRLFKIKKTKEFVRKSALKSCDKAKEQNKKVAY